MRGFQLYFTLTRRKAPRSPLTVLILSFNLRTIQRRLSLELRDRLIRKIGGRPESLGPDQRVEYVGNDVCALLYLILQAMTLNESYVEYLSFCSFCFLQNHHNLE